MANTTGLPALFATGIHSARPAASAVGSGGLYSCTTHSLVYQTDGASTWSTWATLSGGGSALTVKDEGTNLDTAVTSIDFVGAGVVATNSTHAVTVTVAGGGGSTPADVAAVGHIQAAATFR